MADTSDNDGEDREPEKGEGANDAGEQAADEPVGYRNPPRHTRWKKGQSGNPGGRPKNARGLKTDLRAELVSRMDIRMNGQVVSGTRQQLMLRTLSARAASGDIRATRILIDLVMQVFGPEDHGGSEKRLSAQDQEILDELLARKSAASAENAAKAGPTHACPKEPLEPGDPDSAIDEAVEMEEIDNDPTQA